MRSSSALLTALVLIAPIVSGAAVPFAAEHAPETRRDSNEIIYITNCRRETAGGGHYLASYAAWYANWANSQSGEHPDAISNEYRDWSHDGGTTITFEGREQVFSFPNGPTLYIHIDGGGLNVGFQNYAGYIDRDQGGTWTHFYCYRDSGRRVFAWWNFALESAWPGLYCDSVYYCHM